MSAIALIGARLRVLMFSRIVAVVMLVRFIEMAVIIVKLGDNNGSVSVLLRQVWNQILVVSYACIARLYLVSFGIIYDDGFGAICGFQRR